MRVGKLSKLLEAFESHISLFGLIAASASAMASAVMTYLAAITDFLDPYGPFIYGVIALLTVFLTALTIVIGYSIYGWAKARSALAEYTNKKSEAYSVNVLAPTHTHERINISEFYHPYFKSTEKVRFENCEFMGPVAAAFIGCNFHEPLMSNCEIVIIKKDQPLQGVTCFKHSTFIDCKFYRITWFMDINEYNHLLPEMRKAIPVISRGSVEG